MEAVKQLRAAARARRDKICRQASAECEKALASIDTVEALLCGKSKPEREPTMTAYVTNVPPVDKPFSIPHVVELLEAAHPWRLWNRRSVESMANILQRKKIIRRFSQKRFGKGRAPMHTAYIRADSMLQPEDPFADTNLRDAIYRVLKGRELSIAELSVALVEAGYRTIKKPSDSRHHLSKRLRKDSRFNPVGDKWSC